MELLWLTMAAEKLYVALCIQRDMFQKKLHESSNLSAASEKRHENF